MDLAPALARQRSADAGRALFTEALHGPVPNLVGLQGCNMSRTDSEVARELGALYAAEDSVRCIRIRQHRFAGAAARAAPAVTPPNPRPLYAPGAAPTIEVIDTAVREPFYAPDAEDDERGKECTVLYHGTSSIAALAIVRSQQFRPSCVGMLGKGVYVTLDRDKARVYQRWAKGSGATRGDTADTGCMLRCRGFMGTMAELCRHDKRMQTWHDDFGFDSAHSAGCSCTPCCESKKDCSSANGIAEEHCIFDPLRIDRIEIIDGPACMRRPDGSFEGREYWWRTHALEGVVQHLDGDESFWRNVATLLPAVPGAGAAAAAEEEEEEGGGVAAEIAKMGLPQLRAMCDAKGLPRGGGKGALQDRLLASYA